MLRLSRTSSAPLSVMQGGGGSGTEGGSSSDSSTIVRLQADPEQREFISQVLKNIQKCSDRILRWQTPNSTEFNSTTGTWWTKALQFVYIGKKFFDAIDKKSADYSKFERQLEQHWTSAIALHCFAERFYWITGKTNMRKVPSKDALSSHVGVLLKEIDKNHVIPSTQSQSTWFNKVAAHPRFAGEQIVEVDVQLAKLAQQCTSNKSALIDVKTEQACQTKQTNWLKERLFKLEGLVEKTVGRVDAVEQHVPDDALDMRLLRTIVGRVDAMETRIQAIPEALAVWVEEYSTHDECKVCNLQNTDLRTRLL